MYQNQCVASDPPIALPSPVIRMSHKSPCNGAGCHNCVRFECNKFYRSIVHNMHLCSLCKKCGDVKEMQEKFCNFFWKSEDVLPQKKVHTYLWKRRISLCSSRYCTPATGATVNTRRSPIPTGLPPPTAVTGEKRRARGGSPASGDSLAPGSPAQTGAPSRLGAPHHEST